jgi:hypothetical protein
MRLFSNISNLMPQKPSIALKEERLSPIMQLIKKHKFFKVVPAENGYFVYIGKYCFAINEQPTSLQVSLIKLSKNVKDTKDLKSLRQGGLDVLIEFSLILFKGHKKLPIQLCSANTQDEVYLWHQLKQQAYAIEPIDVSQKERFKHWDKLKSLSSIHSKALSFRFDDQQDAVASLRIEGEQVIQMLHFSLVYSDWSASYDSDLNQWLVEVNGKEIVCLQEGDWQKLLLNVSSVLEFGAAQLMAKLAMVMFDGSNAKWVLNAGNAADQVNLYYAAMQEGASIDAIVHSRIEAFIKEQPILQQKQLDLLGEQGQVAMIHGALDKLLFDYDKGERSYRKQSLKKSMDKAAWNKNNQAASIVSDDASFDSLK